MEFIASLFLAMMLFWIGTRLFWRFNLAFPLDNIRLGRLHYLLFGILLGIFLPEDDLLFRKLDQLRFSLIGILLVWFGFRAGSNFDPQKFQQSPLSQTGAKMAQLVVVFALVVLLSIVAAPLLVSYLGLKEDFPLVFLFLGCFSLTIRSGPSWTSASPTFEAQNLHFLHNATSLILLGLGTPLLLSSPVIQVGLFSLIGYVHVLAATLVMGLFLGITFDFIFRTYQNGYRCTFLTVASMVSLGGACVDLKIPPLFVGFISGAWLIHTTVQKRQVLELLDRTSAVLEPAFFILIGSVIGGYGGSPFFKGISPFVFAGILLTVRVFAYMASQVIVHRILLDKHIHSPFFFSNWTPLGNLGIALSIQILFLPIELENNTLVTGTLLAVFISQALQKPSPAFSTPTIAIE